MRSTPAALLTALLAAGCVATPPPPAVAPPPTPRPSPTAGPTATPETSPMVAPVPPAPRPWTVGDLDEPRIRVLLERTTGEVVLPQPGRPYRVLQDGSATWIWGPVALRLDDPGEWQVAAVSDPAAASAAVDRLRSAVPAVEARGVAGEDGLIRIRVRWPAGPPPDPAAVLAAAGFAGAYPVRAAARAVLVPDSGPEVAVTDEAVLEAYGGWPVAVDDRRYRGRLRVRTAAAELLVINEVALEAYLRGVVPVEMGPGQFPELEALKAQAVAARTYAVAHLGDHDDEGYDLCDTPACQVYGGEGVEHPLSDRAVRDTAGIVATYRGAPIDAMFTSTCGGHTDDAGALFSGRGEPYLQGVACAWERPLEIVGRGPDGGWGSRSSFEEEVALEALRLERSAATPPAALRAVAAACGGRVEVTVPASGGAAHEAYAGALLTAAGLDGAGDHLTDASSAEDRLLALADLFEISLGHPPDGSWAAGWHLRAALAVLELQGVVSRDDGELVPHPTGVAIYPRRGDRSEPLGEGSPVWLRWGDELAPRGVVQAFPGTAVERWRRGDRVLAVTVIRSDGGAEADRRSAWRQWARDRDWATLASSLGVPDLERLVITARTPAGRVVGLAAEGRAGTRREWRGFEIRRLLELPENLFTMHAMARDDGTRIVRFLGRGWGHGVGLCQHGAYGLARSGMTYDRILAHYYPGTALETWP